MNSWTFIMRWSTLGKWRHYAKTGVRKRAPAGASNSATCCWTAMWTKSLPPCGRSVGDATVRRSANPRAYFARNQSRMGYAKLIAMKLPIGSGAIESTVRRVVNLRLKGPSLFWCRANAEAILLLRSYYKAGRWNMLKRMATSHLALLEG
jgi:hypothetical protein